MKNYTKATEVSWVHIARMNTRRAIKCVKFLKKNGFEEKLEKFV